MKTYTHNHTEKLTTLRATKLLIYLLGVLYQMIGQCMPGGIAYQRYAREARQVRRSLDKHKRHNWRVIVKWGVLRSKALRDKVLSDLGGEAALLKWELRAARAHRKVYAVDGPPIRQAQSGHRATKDKAPRKTAQVTTDRLGLFRLAPIVKPKRKRAPRFADDERETKERMAITPKPVNLNAVFENCGLDETGKFHYDYDPAGDSIKPIPLLPDELRGVDIRTCPVLEARYQAIIAKYKARQKPQDTETPKLEYHPQAEFLIERSKRELKPVCPDATQQDDRVLVPP